MYFRAPVEGREQRKIHDCPELIEKIGKFKQHDKCVVFQKFWKKAAHPGLLKKSKDKSLIFKKDRTFEKIEKSQYCGKILKI